MNGNTNSRNSRESFQVSEAAGKQQRSGMYVSRSLVIIIMVFFVTILLTIGLLVGLLGRRTNTEKIVYVPIEQTTRDGQQTTTPVTTTPMLTTDAFGDGPWRDVRLPPEIEPLDYTLHFYNIDYNAGKYKGNTTMKFKLTGKLKHILFHIKFLDIDSVELSHEDDGLVGIERQFSYVKNQYYVLEAKNEFEEGEYEMKVLYTGSTTIGIVGMYQSSYEEDGVSKTMIATKFEPTDARKAFPCFDEPQLKATYEVTVEHVSNSYALSNFPVESTETNGDRVTTRFERTFKMSTYLVAWAVVPNDFGYEELFSEKDNKPVRVYGRKYAKEQGLLKYAVDVAKKSLDYFENVYFKISDAVPPKIDLIAIPDFPSGAMENWGLIGFRETSLLYSNRTNSAQSKQNIANTIAHEIAHFWFGNLVTCKWWNDLWLNEAMATFLEYKAMNYIEPSWTLDEQVIMLDIVPVMYDDAFRKSHPVEANVTTPDQINNVFDSITYSKGASLLRMLESVVGEDGFRDGLKEYLLNNKFDSGIAAEFYNSLKLPDDMKDKTTPAKFMDYWLLQMNYPIVEVGLNRIPSEKSTMFTFTQDRFLISIYDDESKPSYTSPFNYTWQIYLRCIAGGTYDANGDDDQHFEGEPKEFTLFLDKKSDSYKLNDRLYTWVKCNPDFRSYYTTLYTSEIYDVLMIALQTNHKAFSIGDRANLIHDAFQIAFEGSISYGKVGELASYLQFNEKDYIPWRVFLYHSSLLTRLLEHRGSFKEFSNYAIDMVDDLIAPLNLFQESNGQKTHLDSLLETNIVEFLCRMQTEQCLTNTSRFFSKIPKEYFFNPDTNENPVPTGIRASVYKYHLQNSYDAKDWFDVFRLYQQTKDPAEKNIAQLGLSYTRATWLLNYYLQELMRNGSSIRKQDFFTVLNAVSRNPAGRDMVWYFYRLNWDELVAKFGLSDRTFGRCIKSISESFSNSYFLQEILDFYRLYPNAGAGEEPRKQAVEVVQTNIMWIQDREEDLINSLVGPQLRKREHRR